MNIFNRDRLKSRVQKINLTYIAIRVPFYLSLIYIIHQFAFKPVSYQFVFFILLLVLIGIFEYALAKINKTSEKFAATVQSLPLMSSTQTGSQQKANQTGTYTDQMRLIIEALSEQIIDKNDQLQQLQHILDPRADEQHQAEQELSRADLIFHKFWEISVDGMRLTDENGTIISANKAFCRTFQLEQKQLEGKPFAVTYHPAERQEAINKYKNDLENDALETHFERECILWNNQRVWLSFSNSFLQLNRKGKIVLSVITDITKRKMAEFELLNSEKRFRMLFNNANDAVFVNRLDEGSSHLGSFLEVNNVACRRLGYTREELLALPPSATFPPKYINAINDAVKQLKKSGYTIFEARHMSKDRREIPVEISAHLFNLDGSSTILSIARDITERKRAEKKLFHTSEQLRKLATRLQTIREEERTMIAQEIHDELGQYLTVLKIQNSLLINKLRKDQTFLRKKIDSILQMIDQAVEVVQKISAKLRPGVLDELGLISAIEWQANEFRERTGISCEHILPKQELVIQGQKATAIFRILQEALTNVARHADAKKVSVILKQQNDLLTLEITDNGRGISTSQINNPNSLGLLGMQERAMVFGGQVSIHGVPGQGTNVKVEMPLRHE